MENRATGWLNADFHHHFREALLHAGGRYSVGCACYVLMPDHWHLVWLGLESRSDQWLATAFLRKVIRRSLGSARMQDRAYDHVARGREGENDAIARACHYVLENPQRAGLSADWRDWPYGGSIMIGYPRLDPRTENFWADFWKIYNCLVEREGS